VLDGRLAVVSPLELSMNQPVPEPRTDLNLKHFRTLLNREKERLESEIRDMEELDRGQSQSEELGESADYDQHQADVATDTFMRERDEAMERSLKGELEQVTHALDKVESGAYGYCDRCSGPIPADRLKALPYATLCISCAGMVEATS
jgi:DnaK suppressor protein